MSKKYDISAITAITLIAAASSTIHAGITDDQPNQANALHRLCIMVETDSQSESPRFSAYTDSPDFNMVHSEALIHQSDEDEEYAAVSESGTSTHLLERPDCSPAQFLALIDF